MPKMQDMQTALRIVIGWVPLSGGNKIREIRQGKPLSPSDVTSLAVYLCS